MQIIIKRPGQPAFAREIGSRAASINLARELVGSPVTVLYARGGIAIAYSRKGKGFNFRWGEGKAITGTAVFLGVKAGQDSLTGLDQAQAMYVWREMSKCT